MHAVKYPYGQADRLSAPGGLEYVGFNPLYSRVPPMRWTEPVRNVDAAREPLGSHNLVSARSRSSCSAETTRSMTVVTTGYTS